MKKILLTTVSAGLIAMAGPALAQTGGTSPGAEPPAMEREGTSPGTPGADSPAMEREGTSPGTPGADSPAMEREGTSPGTPGAAPGAGAVQEAMPPPDAVGKTLKGAEGERIGNIDAIEGNNVIVSVGGFLGIGARDVAIPWSEVTMIGAGEDAELQTSLTRDQVKELPKYERGDTTGSATPR